MSDMPDLNDFENWWRETGRYIGWYEEEEIGWRVARRAWELGHIACADLAAERERELVEALTKAGNQLLRYGDPRGDEALALAKHTNQEAGE